MVKSKKSNLHLEVSNDVDLEYETDSTTSSRKMIKGKALTKTKNSSLKVKAQPMKSDSFLIINGKKIPLSKSKVNQRTVQKKKASKRPKRSFQMKSPKSAFALNLFF